MGHSFHTCKIKAIWLEFLGSLPDQTDFDSIALAVSDVHGYQHENNSYNGIAKWTKLEMTNEFFKKNMYSNLEFSPSFSGNQESKVSKTRYFQNPD